ncbi:polyprenyl synthetase family protein [Streptomyces caniscabiei]|uniref:Polyprenyl synthetase family protein n=1 Tax=Streptomyces caniscabiei TaxID=2746961 RepID=A0A927KZJ1_9ACTN|nr:polyprenyl synthetase family protein [Streptomyces caniscabiei]MBD9722166.1 polyprenyl synthetase family protein [Streptomyces caniscabiei]MDX3509362.1 polyprenyl synthetase family protein [Streptomyces caniscabiei]MDX3716885.1 polyprenyl synthetase family protein [Streptomyces caniscabiei]WEO22758.1 polyprenyl synthetase family protein [Streptomyces caniscabiei]
MTTLSYAELHRQVASDIDAEIAGALASLGPSTAAVRRSISGLLGHQQMKYPLSVLPLLVHACETGVPGPAVPLSAVHVLWWTSACYLDDLADGHGAHTPAGLGRDEALLASVLSGQALPIRVVQAQPVPDAVRNALTREIVDCWIDAVEGQLRDLRGDPANASRDAVVAAYRGKSGAPFAMITAMAAILSGAGTERTELWREFGDVFGILWQLFNDQEDLLSGRDEDLRNGTVTHLLACALEEEPSGSRARVAELGRAARDSAPARARLRATLLAPAVLRRFEKDLTAFRDDAHRVLDELGGDETYLPALRQLVDQAAGMYLTEALP